MLKPKELRPWQALLHLHAIRPITDNHYIRFGKIPKRIYQHGYVLLNADTPDIQNFGAIGIQTPIPPDLSILPPARKTLEVHTRSKGF